MNRDEAKHLVMIMASTYPNFKPMDLTKTVDAWAFVLEDYSYIDIAKALKTYISTSASDFAPSVSHLIQLVSKDETFGEAEAWDAVRKAISRATYYADEEFAKFPSDAIRKAVGSANQLRIWASDENFNDGVESSNFKRVYREEVKRSKEVEAYNNLQIGQSDTALLKGE